MSTPICKTLSKHIDSKDKRAVRPRGKRGRLTQAKVQNVWDRMKLHEEVVPLFAKNADVPFTNNRAEKDLRMGKVKQKVGNCFRERKYVGAYCQTSYLQSTAYSGCNPWAVFNLRWLVNSTCLEGEQLP